MGVEVDREKGLMTDWRRIGTAPKDRKFLGFLQDHRTSRIEICVWSDAEQAFLPLSRLANPASWRSDAATRALRITHWMPLPTLLDEP